MCDDSPTRVNVWVCSTTRVNVLDVHPKECMFYTVLTNVPDKRECVGLFTHQTVCVGLFTHESKCVGLFTHRSVCV